MDDAAPEPTLYAFDCPVCNGAFEVEAQWLGQAIPCPHCDEDVQLPEPEPESEPAAPAEPLPPPPLPSSLPSSTPRFDVEVESPVAASDQSVSEPSPSPALEPPTPAPERKSSPNANSASPNDVKIDRDQGVRLTPEERAALRKKMNLALAVIGAVLLAVVFTVLAQLG